MKKMINRFLSLMALTLFITFQLTAQDKNQIERVWYNQEKTSKIQVYLAKDGGYYGKIVWLKELNDKETGKPRTDKENPDPKHKNHPLLGSLILRNFKISKEDANEYVGGTVYDPKNGKTYCGKIAFKGNTLDLRGFICSVSFLGRTSTWTLAED